MQVCKQVSCERFPCQDVRHECYVVPAIHVNPNHISIVMISEAAPPDPGDYFYAAGKPLFQETTVEVFQQAGADVASAKDILRLGVYMTTAVKCGKIEYGIKSGTIQECSRLLERELALFPKAQVYMLMGDVAIKALNAIVARAGEGRVIPAGSTYKLRGQEYFFRGRRVFPSYLQVGPNFFIEKGKHQVIAEDVAQALRLVEAI